MRLRPVAETPFLKATYDAFKDNPNFRMIGLSLDPKIQAPRDYAATNQLGWPIGFLGDWAKADLPDKYGVTGIPAIFPHRAGQEKSSSVICVARTSEPQSRARARPERATAER